MAGLLRNTRALVRVGRRLALATPDCVARCCNGCQSWLRIVSCPAPDCGDNNPPPSTTAYICSTVRCTNGQPLTPLVVFILDGQCWSVAVAAPIPVPPPGSLVVQTLDPVECLPDGCADPRCPQGALYLIGVPCNPVNQPRWFCGVNECGVYAYNGVCYLIDPATGYVPFADLPQGAVVAAMPQGTPHVPSCCDCETSGGCVRVPIYPPSDPCPYQWVTECCCPFVPFGQLGPNRVRVRQFSFSQNVGYGDGLVHGGRQYQAVYTNSIESETIDPVTQCATYTIRHRATWYDNDGNVIPSITVDNTFTLTPDCASCGGPVNYVTSGVNDPATSNQIVFGGGFAWRESCESDPPIPPFSGQRVVVAGWFSRLTCRTFANGFTNVYTAPQMQTITTTYGYLAENVAIDGSPNPCGGGCAGALQSQSNGGGRATQGCAGCGKGQSRIDV